MTTMMNNTTPQQQQQQQQLHNMKKSSLLQAVDTFDKNCGKEQPNRLPLKISAQEDINDVEFLEDLPPPDGAFFKVPYRELAGIGTKDGDITNKSYETHYLREEVTTLWQKIDRLAYKHNLAIQGQPGTGKSTAVWRKVLEMAFNGDNVLWVSLSRDGNVKSAVYFQARYFYKFHMETTEIRIFLVSEEIPLDTVVLDGRSQHPNCVDAVSEIEYWVKHPRASPKSRAISTASTKVERLRPHQNDEVDYTIVHSWTIEDFNGAFLQEGQPTSLFVTCAELFYEEYGIESLCNDDDDDDDDDISSADISSTNGMEITEEKSAGTGSKAEEKEEKKAVVGDNSNELIPIPPTDGMEYTSEKSGGSDDSDETGTSQPSPRKKLKLIPVDDILAFITHRYVFTGGSAHWMFNYKKETIEKYLKDYCKATNNRQDIQNGVIGPTSNAATNYFFGSSRQADGDTEYFLVSKRAVEILGETTAGAVYPGLYSFAERLENPSFLGWIVEADFFSQVDGARKSQSELPLRKLSDRCAPLRPITTHGFEHTKNKNRVLRKATQHIVDIASRLVISNSRRPFAVCCKPTTWNQGGYNAFFVEFAKEMTIHLRFFQITRGQSHTLKGEYLYTVISFFEKAGYTVEEVEISFILTYHNSISFSLKDITGVGFLKKYSVYNSSKKWDATNAKIAKDVARYELTLSKLTHL